MRAFTKVWQKQRARLKELGVLDRFQDRLARLWSIETGVLERLYDLSRGLTVMLVERGFHSSLVSHGDATMDGDRLVEILEDHREGLSMVMDLIDGTRGLTVGWIKELHALLTRHQTTADGITHTGQRVQIPLLSGAFKQRPNNPTRPDGTVHEYCPWEHTPSEMDRLVQLYEALPPEFPEVRAAWLHHRFTQIHPFQDGNGRVARALASVEFIRAGLLPLLVERDDRDTRYIPALESADNGDLQPLVTFFADCMSRVLLRASAEADAVVSNKNDFRAILRAGRRKVQARQTQAVEAQEDARRRFNALADDLVRHFDMIRIEVMEELPEVRAEIFIPAPEQAHWFRFQVTQLARHHNYWLDLNAPRTWVRLRLQTSTGQIDTIVSLHRLQGSSVGTWVCDAFLQQRDATPGEGGQPDILFLDDVEPLLLTVDENPHEQLGRLEAWIERMKLHAAARWSYFL